METESAILDLPPEPSAYVENYQDILAPRREEVSGVVIDDSHKDPPDPPHHDHDVEPQPRDYPMTPGTGSLSIEGYSSKLIHSHLEGERTVLA